MTDDLTTLLRDAGREPTIDLDMDQVHARGRRRTFVRRIGTGVGALVLLAVLGVGVAALVDQPDTPVVDEVPSEQPAEDRTPAGDASEGEGEGPSAEAADRELSARLGVGTHRLVGEDGRTRIVRGTPDAAWGRLTDSGIDVAHHASLAVTAAGDVWWAAEDGELQVLPAGDVGTPTLAATSGPGHETWRVLGSDGRGEVLLGLSRPDAATSAEQFTIHRTNGDRVGPALAGLDVVGSIEGDGEPYEASSGPDAPEELAVLDAIGESYGVTVLRQGDEADTAVLAGGLDHWLADVAVVGRDLWILESGTDGDVDVLIRPLDGGQLRRVATPVGRDVEGYVLDLSVAEGRNGPVGALSVVTEEGASNHVASWTADLAAVAAAATPSEPMQPGPGEAPSVWERTELAGRLLLTPLGPEDASSDGPTAACATGTGLQLNPPPGIELAVWFLCWDALDQLPTDGAHPFVHGEDRFVAAEIVPGADGIQAVLEAWAAGPRAEEAGRGLTGGLDPTTADIADVTIDGTTVTVDLAAGPQVGVLGTTTGRATTVQALVGAVIQFDGYGDLQVDEVVITLDGSCEAWAALAEVEGCPSYDQSHAPWAQVDVANDDLADGRHAVYLLGSDTDQRNLVVDVIQWLSGEEARAAYEAATGETDGPPNDYYIVNDDQTRRTLPVAADLDVQLVRLRDDSDADLDPGTFDELPDYVEEYGGQVLAWLTIEDGVVVAIEEQYVP